MPINWILGHKPQHIWDLGWSIKYPFCLYDIVYLYDIVRNIVWNAMLFVYSFLLTIIVHAMKQQIMHEPISKI